MKTSGDVSHTGRHTNDYKNDLLKKSKTYSEITHKAWQTFTFQVINSW